MSARYLFDDVLCSKEYVESKLRPIYPALWLAATESFEYVLARRAANDPSFVNIAGDELSSFLRPQIAWRATKILQKHHPDVGIRQKQCGTLQMFTIIVDDIAVSVKRLDDDLKRSNYRTRNQSLYWRDSLFQDSLAHRVIFGYRLMKSESEIMTYLTMPGPRRNAWAISIQDQSEAAAHMRNVPAKQGRYAEERKGFRVTKVDKKDVADGAG
jgi:hypothetical protein